MKSYEINVNFLESTISPDIIKVVQNDYNSIELDFTFDITADTVLFKVLYPNNKIYVSEVKDNKIILEKGVLNVSGIYKVEISLYGSDSCLTNYAVFNMEVRSDLVDSDKIVEADSRVPVLSDLINDTYTAIDDLKEKIDNGYLKGDKGDKGDTGAAGRDGYMQYTAGANISIVGNTISAIQPNLTNYATKSYVDDAISSAITDALEGSY